MNGGFCLHLRGYLTPECKPLDFNTSRHGLRRILHNLFRKETQSEGIVFSRPLALLESDDWGRVGVRDREGFDQLRANGIRLGEHPYDLYTLETANDVGELAALLMRHRDSSGRPASLVMNFCLANLDFTRMKAAAYRRVELLSLGNGLPGGWSRPGLFEAYKKGIRQGVFYPATHGLTHFCPLAMENALAENADRARLLRTFWEAETPYVYWRMPWIGYEYWNPGKPQAGFLRPQRQRELIQQSCSESLAFFGRKAVSACAPGYRANRDTHRAWAESGVRVVQNGTGSGLQAPYIDEFGLLHVFRAIDLEPALKEIQTKKYLEIACACVARGIPIVISVHAINFHSSLKDFRSTTLNALDSLLTALESKFPDLLYVNHEELYKAATDGTLPSGERYAAPGTRMLRRPELQEAL